MTVGVLVTALGCGAQFLRSVRAHSLGFVTLINAVGSFRIDGTTGLISEYSETATTGSFHDLAIRSDGSKFFGSGPSSSARAYQITPRPVSLSALTSPAVAFMLSALRWTRSDRFLIAGTSDGKVETYGTSATSELALIQTQSAGGSGSLVLKIATHPEGRVVAVVSSSSPRLTTYLLSDEGLLTPAFQYANVGGSQAIELHPSGSFLYTGLVLSSYRVDGQSGEVVKIQTVSPAFVTSYSALTPEGSWLFVANYSGSTHFSTIKSFSVDANSGLLTESASFSLEEYEQILSLAPHPDGGFLYGLTDQKKIHVFAINATDGSLRQVGVQATTGNVSNFDARSRLFTIRFQESITSLQY
ncbi:MAG: lactonase family protein [Bacteriovoracia bacterium]